MFRFLCCLLYHSGTRDRVAPDKDDSPIIFPLNHNIGGLHGGKQVGKVIDYAGKKIGRLTVVARAGTNRQREAMWLCKCECGNETIIRGSDVRTGHTKSCGCLKLENSKKMLTKHGKRHTRLYHIWCGMKTRCNNPKDIGYSLYGGRGIKVCEEWSQDFVTFHKWATENGYTDEMTIDRIDADGNYCPENCRWVTQKAQQNNRRNNHFILYNGETHTITEWAEITNIKPATIYDRLKRGWAVELALTAKASREE